MASITNNQIDNTSLNNQMESLRFASNEEVEFDPLEGMERSFDPLEGMKTSFDSLEGMSTLDEQVANYTKEDALKLAASMGIWDTYRGVKQIIGFDEEQMEQEQKLLNKLMEHPEWGGAVKATWFGSMILDPAGWLIPGVKAIQAGRMAVRAGRLVWHGSKWGAIAGGAGYVDKESSDRLTNAAMGLGAGAVLAPALGIGVRPLVKLATRGKKGETVSDFTNTKTAKQLTDNPKENIKEFTGNDQPRLVNPVKRFYYGLFQPARQQYQELTSKFIYKPIVLDNPLASLVGAGTGAAVIANPDTINYYYNRMIDENDRDTGPWRLSMIAAIGALSGFGAAKVIGKKKIHKGTELEETVEDYFGRRLIENYKLDPGFKKLKETSFVDFHTIDYHFTDIANRAKVLKDDEKKLLYQFLDGQIDHAGLEKVVTKEALELGTEARDLIRNTGQMMVDAGMLKFSTWNKNVDSYIHRTYAEKLNKQEKEVLNQLGLMGMELMPRGHLQRIPITNTAKIKKRLSEGYEKLGDPHNGEQIFRRHLTKAEREGLDEIEDAAFAIRATGDLMLNDLAVYKFYEDVKKGWAIYDVRSFKALSKSEQTAYRKTGRKLLEELSPDERASYIDMPTTKHLRTGIQKYGSLSGMYLPKGMADDIKIQRAWSDPEGNLGGKIYNSKNFKKYRKVNSLWKRTKTSWNPTVHMNNIVSNFFLLDAHNVSPTVFFAHGWKVFTEAGRKSLNNNKEFGKVYDDLERLGVFNVSLIKQELNFGKKSWKEIYLEEFKNAKLIKGDTEVDDIIKFSNNVSGNIYESTVAASKKVGRGAKWIDDTLTEKIYQREDQMFRVALYLDRLQKSKDHLLKFNKGTPEYETALEALKREAASEARAAFIDYNIQSPWIKVLRDSAVPFISYSYRVIPILAKTATTQPHKFAKWAAIGYALDYAGKEFSQEETEYERALMKEKEKARMFGLPFMPPTYIKAPHILGGLETFAQKRFDTSLAFGATNDATTGKALPNTSLFFDITRFIPGGDVLGQTSPESGGIIPFLPAPFQPSFGMLGEVIFPLFMGVDPFSGRYIDKVDKEKVTLWNRLLFIGQRLVPNNPIVGVSGWQYLVDEIPGVEYKHRFREFDSHSMRKIMNSIEQRSDASPYSEDLSVYLAIAQTIGIKLWPFEIDKAENLVSAGFRREQTKFKARLSTIEKELYDYRGTPLYKKERLRAENKMQDLNDEWAKIVFKYKIIKSKQP